MKKGYFSIPYLLPGMPLRGLGLPLLMLFFTLVAQAQPKAGGGSSLAAGPSPGIPGPAVTASQLTICQGGTAVLTASPGQVANGNSTYAWSAAQDISALSGERVVVAPLQTTTYTVAITANGVTTNRSITIQVAADCCQTTKLDANGITMVELDTDYPYDPTLPFDGDPFRHNPGSPTGTYPPGTYFHVAGGTLTLTNNNYPMPPGSVLLMEAGADIVLDDARLTLNGSTVTAACDDM